MRKKKKKSSTGIRESKDIDGEREAQWQLKKGETSKRKKENKKKTREEEAERIKASLGVDIHLSAGSLLSTLSLSLYLSICFLDVSVYLSAFSLSIYLSIPILIDLYLDL